MRNENLNAYYPRETKMNDAGFSLLNAAVPLTKGAWAVVSTSRVQAIHQMGSWYLHCSGYARRSQFVPGTGKQQSLPMHRVIAQLMGLNPNGLEVDHVNGDKLDNRDENLRVATHAQNSKNKTRKRTDGTSSKFKGVSWDKRAGKWHARIMSGAVAVHLGRFEKEQDAANAYAVAAVRLHGEFAAPRVERK